MRSSEIFALATSLAVAAGALALPGCAAPHPTAAPKVSAEAACMQADGARNASRAKAPLLLEQQTRSQPLFLALAPAGVRTCRITGDDDSESGIEFTFGNGATLSRTHNPRIEYVEQRARFVTALPLDPTSLLRDTERAAFPPEGCGIHWNKPETSVQDGPPAINSAIYRGQQCNCMGMVQRQSGLPGATLIFRNTC